MFEPIINAAIITVSIVAAMYSLVCLCIIPPFRRKTVPTCNLLYVAATYLIWSNV